MYSINVDTFEKAIRKSVQQLYFFNACLSSLMFELVAIAEMKENNNHKYLNVLKK